MEAGGPSRTAITTATLRAAHYLLDGVPKVLDDPFARSFAGFANDEDLLNALKAMVYPDFPRMRTLFALRNRYAEDELVRTIERGTSQYIILGAGLDSFAYRRPDLLQTIKGAWSVFPTSHSQSAQRGSYLFDETLTPFRRRRSRQAPRAKPAIGKWLTATLPTSPCFNT